MFLLSSNTHTYNSFNILAQLHTKPNQIIIIFQLVLKCDIVQPRSIHTIASTYQHTKPNQIIAIF